MTKKIELTEDHIWTIINALSNSERDCAEAALGSDNPNVVALFRESADKYHKLAEVFQQVESVVIKLEDTETVD